MTKLILTTSSQETLLRWAAPRVELEGPWEAGSEAMGAVEAETGKIVAVMVVNGFLGDCAVVHFASDGRRAWGNRAIIKGWFGYLFLFKGLRQVVGFTPAGNAPMLKMLLQAGFRFEGRIRRSPDGTRQDIITSMFASECPWLKEEGEPVDGEEISA